MILIAALIVQEQRVSIRLGDEQVSSAIAIHVGGNQGTRIHQLYLVELHSRRHILKAGGPQVAQCAQFRSLLRLHRHNQVAVSDPNQMHGVLRAQSKLGAGFHESLVRAAC